jgi:hypothetical protein
MPYVYRCGEEFRRSLGVPHVFRCFRGDHPAILHLHHADVVDQEGAVLPLSRLHGGYRPSHRQTLILAQIANSFAGILGPLLSYGVGRAVDTSSHPPIFEYQGIFLFLGGISFCFVPLVWALLPNSPTTARFLRHGNDRLIAIDRLRANNTGTKESFCLIAANWQRLMVSSGFPVQVESVLGDVPGPQNLHVGRHVVLRRPPLRGSWTVWWPNYQGAVHRIKFQMRGCIHSLLPGLWVRSVHHDFDANPHGSHWRGWTVGLDLRDEQDTVAVAGDGVM